MQMRLSKGTLESKVRNAITLPFLLLMILFVVILLVVFSLSLQSVITSKNNLIIRNVSSHLFSSVQEVLEEVQGLAENPIIASNLSSQDTGEIAFLLNGVMEKNYINYISLRDSSGKELVTVRESHFKGRLYDLKKTDLFKSVSLQQIQLVDEAGLKVVVPTSFHPSAQAVLLADIDLLGILSDSVGENVSYSLIQRGKELYSDGKKNKIGDISFENYDGIFGTAKLNIGVYVDENPYYYVFWSLFGLFVVAVGTVVLLSFWISRNISVNVTQPIKTLVRKVNEMRHDETVRCAPIGTHDEIELLALAFDEKTYELTMVNSTLERKVKERTYELVIEKNKAQEALKVRSQFLANMSHEIRTPLNGIIGITDQILERKMDDELKDQINIVQNSGQVLLNVVNDILDFSKIESGNISLERIGFKLNDKVKNTINLFKNQARQKKLKLSVSFQKGMPEDVIGDPHRLSQVLFNVIGNAIKFTSKGRVSVSVLSSEREKGEYLYIFNVTDTGIGISQDKIDTLFVAFEQADSSVTRRFGGTGLGLSISKMLTGIMGGDIKVSSEIGKGSTFSIQIPLKLANKSSASSSARVEVLPSVDREAKILVAEDNTINQRIILNYLKIFGFSCTVANDGVEAVDLAAKNNYDLVLMDMQMPILDGIGATKKILENKKNKDIKIVAMTANAFKEHKKLCFAAGMCSFIAKPITKSALVHLLNDVLPRTGSGGEKKYA